MNRLRLTLSTAYAASLLPSWVRFAAAAERPEATAHEALTRWLRRHGDSAYGRFLGLERVRDVEGFRKRAPIVIWDDVAPWVERAASGEPGVLGPEKCRAYERTSGTTGGNKLIPLTPTFLSEVERATSPWLFELFRHRPSLLGTRSYWSISPVARVSEKTPDGTPIGLSDDTEYFGPIARRALTELMAVPAEVARISDIERWQRATLIHLLAAEDLGLLSVWSPSFLSVLVEVLTRKIDELLTHLPVDRRRSLDRSIARAGGPTGRALWPKLQVISCWADGPAAPLLPPVEAFFSGVEIQPKGLLSTEGVVTFPIGPPGACLLVPAITSHFLELWDLEVQCPRLPHEARLDGIYAPVLTTGSGLCRYQLRDQIRCVGFWGRLPVLRFESKLDGGSDLVGEKIALRDAAHALDAGVRLAGPVTFALLAPCRSPRPHYCLYLEGASDPENFAAAVEAELATLHHYRYARDLGQLDPIRSVVVTSGPSRYLSALGDRGARLGDVKPAPLHPGLFWPEVFEAESA